MSQVPPTLFIMQNGQQSGPFPLESVAEMVRVGTFSDADFGWGEGMADWRTLSELVPASSPPSAGGSLVPQGRSRPGQPYVPLPPKPPEERLTFREYVAGAFAFPFRGDGILVLVSGSLFFGILGALVAVGQVPIIAAGSMGATKRVFVLAIFLVGYMAAMIMSVIQSTAHGEHAVPSWPDFGNWWDDIIDPAVKCMALLCLCFGPGIFALGAGNAFDASQTVLLGYILLAAGAVYFPMALLTLSLLDSIWAITPRLVLRSIFAVSGQYMIVLALTAMAFLMPIVLEMVLIKFSNSFIWYGIAAWLVSVASLWAAFFVARILGGLYRSNHESMAF